MTTEHQRDRNRRALTPRWLRWGAGLLVVALAVEYLVVPQLVGAREAVSRVEGADGWMVALALALEAASLLAYTLLTQAVLGSDGLSYWVQLRIDLTGYGFSHIVPGGGTTAAGLRYRLMTAGGVRSADAVSCAALEGAAEFTALAFVFVCGVAVASPQPGRHPFLVTSGLIACAVTGGIVLMGAALHWLPGPLRTAARRVSRVVPWVTADGADACVVLLADRADTMGSNVRLLAKISGWALVNWLLDATCLWVSLHAFGYTAPLGPLLAVYGVANLVGLLPITPGGLGIVEGVVIPVLVSFGAPRGAAVLGVLTWRLVAFWLPIPVSWLTAASLRRDLGGPSDGQHASALSQGGRP